MNNALNAMKNLTNGTTTENGAVAFSSTLSKVLDLFALGGAYRSHTEKETQALFQAAYGEDPLLATKCLFYLRDIRGGQGEREFFRRNLRFLFENSSNKKVLATLVPEYGRWDDLLGVLDFDEVKEVIKRQYNQDLINCDHKKYNELSLLAKWLPSNNTSSEDTRAKAAILQKYLKLTPKGYRKNLSMLRKALKVVEVSLSAKDWKAIDFERVPSQAMLKYRKAFCTHLPEEFNAFFNRVQSGEAKVNTATLFPYQIFSKARSEEASEKTLEMLWDNLPNYVREDDRGIVVADTSGSMFGDPIDVALSLATYFAERNVGPFKDHFITFSSRPVLQEIVGSNLYQKIQSMLEADWGMNTDIDAVFDLLLDTAKTSGVSEEDMPSTIYIISDMQFDSCTERRSNYESAKAKFESQGYKLPTVVFWNVAARNKNVPVKKDENNTVLISGMSPSLFSQVMTGTTPEKFMWDVLQADRYLPINSLF